MIPEVGLHMVLGIHTEVHRILCLKPNMTSLALVPHKTDLASGYVGRQVRGEQVK
jgi:hypothetical protein